jgi:hypothetical protein
VETPQRQFRLHTSNEKWFYTKERDCLKVGLGGAPGVKTDAKGSQRLQGLSEPPSTLWDWECSWRKAGKGPGTQVQTFPGRDSRKYVVQLPPSQVREPRLRKGPHFPPSWTKSATWCSQNTAAWRSGLRSEASHSQ